MHCGCSGVYASWDECEQQVRHYSGALHKSFRSRADAAAFVSAHGGSQASDGAEAGTAPAVKRRRLTKADGAAEPAAEARSVGSAAAAAGADAEAQPAAARRKKRAKSAAAGVLPAVGDAEAAGDGPPAADRKPAEAADTGANAVGAAAEAAAAEPEFEVAALPQIDATKRYRMVRPCCMPVLLKW